MIDNRWINPALALLVAMTGARACAEDAAPAENAAAQSARKLYDQLFGAAERAAMATPDRADDRQLAGELLKYAVGLKVANAEDAAAKLLLLERAYLLTCRDLLAFDTAIKAGTMLSQADRASAKFWEERVALVRERQVRAKMEAGGSATDWKVAGKALLHGMVADADAAWGRREYVKAAYGYRRAASLAGRLKSVDPDPKALDRQSRVASARVLKQAEAQRLVEKLTQVGTPLDASAQRARALLLLVDDAEGAAEALPAGADAELARAVALAKLDAGALSAEQAKELGDWYWSFRDAPEHSAAKAVVAARVTACLERRLELTNDLPQRWHLEAELKSARKLVEAAGAEKP